MNGINVVFSSLGSMKFGIPVFLRKVSDEFIRRGHSCYYFSIYKGKDIDGDVELYHKLGLKPVRIDINSSTVFMYNEYMNYSVDEMEDIVKQSTLNSLLVQRADKKKEYLEEAKQYLEHIRHTDESIGIDMFIVWGNKLRDRAIHHYAKKHNKRIFILEHGYFRPFTLTVDSKGVNYENSLPRESDFYENINLDIERYNHFLLNPESAFIDSELTDHFKLVWKTHLSENHGYSEIFIKCMNKFKKAKVKSIPKLAKLLKRKSIRFYQSQKEDRMLRILNIQASEMFQRKEAYIFVPFQIQSDSQILLFSPNIKKMKDFVESIANAVYHYNQQHQTKLNIIFKLHPLYKDKDPSLNMIEILKICEQFDHCYITNQLDTGELIEGSKAVVTINSTVGIEALTKLKKVITLGDAFYNIDGIAYHVADLSNLSDALEQVLDNDLDEILIKKFLYYIRFNYFSEIFYLSPDDISVSRLVDRFLECEER